MNWHGKALGAKSDEVIQHVESLIKNPDVKPSNILPPVMDAPAVDITNVAMSGPPAYELGQKLATRQAYGTALRKLAENHPNVVALDGDMKNSTFSQVSPRVYIEESKYIRFFAFSFSYIKHFLGNIKS